MAAQPPAQQYVPVTGNVIVAAGLSEENTIHQVLHWIGFRRGDQRQSIIDDSLGSYDDIRMLSEKDVNAMATEWAGRTSNNDRITFGI